MPASVWPNINPKLIPIGTEPAEAAAETLAGTYLTVVPGSDATFLIASRYLSERRYLPRDDVNGSAISSHA